MLGHSQAPHTVPSRGSRRALWRFMSSTKFRMLSSPIAGRKFWRDYNVEEHANGSHSTCLTHHSRHWRNSRLRFI